MSTLGKRWTRKDKKWSDEIVAWLKSICPAREHGFKSRKEIADEINRRFDRDFSLNAFVSHCSECGINLGFASSDSGIARGEKHWRHRAVGSFQLKKNYVRIKVAEPNHWMLYSRYVWEQNHPGESAAGKRIIFMDGNNRNFEPDNLECVTPGEQSVMNSLGCNAGSTRAEREVYLLRARIMCQKNKLMGKEAMKLHNRLKYQRLKDTPEYKAAQARCRQNYLDKYHNDPEFRERQLEKQREYRRTHYDQYITWVRQYHKKRKLEGKE